MGGIGVIDLTYRAGDNLAVEVAAAVHRQAVERVARAVLIGDRDRVPRVVVLVDDFHNGFGNRSRIVDIDRCGYGIGNAPGDDFHVATVFAAHVYLIGTKLWLGDVYVVGSYLRRTIFLHRR